MNLIMLIFRVYLKWDPTKAHSSSDWGGEGGREKRTGEIGVGEKPLQGLCGRCIVDVTSTSICLGWIFVCSFVCSVGILFLRRGLKRALKFTKILHWVRQLLWHTRYNCVNQLFHVLTFCFSSFIILREWFLWIGAVWWGMMSTQRH